MRSTAIGTLCFSLLSLPVFAEEDPMELQRCIWQCQANYGTESAKYPDCVERLCEGGGAEEQSKASAKQEGRWTYGDHPVLGRSAYVEVGDAALGIACVRDQGSFVVSHRMTSGIVNDPTLPDGSGVMTMFQKPFSIGGSFVYQKTPAGFFERTALYCDSEIAQMERSTSIVFLSGKFVGLHFENDGNKMTVEQAGQSIIVANEADLEKLADSRTISLAGSSAAIKQLAKECPALRQQIAEGCDEF